MGSLEERRKTFDEVAELYDRVRPGYPERLVSDVIRLSGIPPAGRILEIGCGTGKATIRFAERGYRMVCLEPGPNLARIMERKTAAFPGVRIESCTFEEWPATELDLDLVIAAQSFHFIDPASGLAKVARCLRPGGALAIFGNHPRGGEGGVHRQLQEAYARHAPELAKDRPETALEDRIDETGLFESVVMTRYPWRQVYTATDYVGLMETQSDHRLLPRDRRDALLRAIGEAITSVGGSLAVDYVARLHLARRRAA
jgi:SAM-dependent methyltransferase